MANRTRGFAAAPWGTMRKCTAICPDGKVRTIRLHEQPDTYFSVRGRTTIKGVAVTGYVSTADGEYFFNMTHDHPKYDLIMHMAEEDLCTCCWPRGHDSRCPATPVYLDRQAKQEATMRS